MVLWSGYGGFIYVTDRAWSSSKCCDSALMFLGNHSNFVTLMLINFFDAFLRFWRRYPRRQYGLRGVLTMPFILLWKSHIYVYSVLSNSEKACCWISRVTNGQYFLTINTFFRWIFFNECVSFRWSWGHITLTSLISKFSVQEYFLSDKFFIVPMV